MKHGFRGQERNERSLKTIRAEQGLYNSGLCLLGDEALTEQNQSAHKQPGCPSHETPPNLK